MSPRLITLFAVALILVSTISHAAARPDPAFREVDSRHEVVEEEKAMEVDDSCEGIGGGEECLMRRTLAAHTDYLYTQELKN